MSRAGATRTMLTAIILAAVTASDVTLCDQISLKGGKVYSGTFEGYKIGRFYFKPVEGKGLHETRVRVESLEVDPPALVSAKRRLKKMSEGIRIKGYRNGSFVFSLEDRNLIVPAKEVSSVKMEPDLRREMQLVKGKVPSPDENAFNLEEAVKPGIVTVVHFHMDSVMASVRQGNYLEQATRKSRGRIKLVKVPLKDWETPAARNYGIRSAPQFWFYNRRGKLSGKLTERFTTDDIDKALRAAKR